MDKKSINIGTEDDPDTYCPDCGGTGAPLPDGADHEEYSRCGNCKGWHHDGPTHYNCCHAPKDMGHMFGCPNSSEVRS